MIKVYQDSFGYGQGNCAWASVASVFELPLSMFDRVGPPHDVDIAKWTECFTPDLKYTHVDMAHNYRLVDGPSVEQHPHPQRWAYDAPAEYEPPASEFWVASVFSPGLMCPIESPYYGMPGLHMVVMSGRRVIHDPNPDYDPSAIDYTVVGKGWWEAR